MQEAGCTLKACCGHYFACGSKAVDKPIIWSERVQLSPHAPAVRFSTLAVCRHCFATKLGSVEQTQSSPSKEYLKAKLMTIEPAYEELVQVSEMGWNSFGVNVALFVALSGEGARPSTFRDHPCCGCVLAQARFDFKELMMVKVPELPSCWSNPLGLVRHYATRSKRVIVQRKALKEKLERERRSHADAATEFKAKVAVLIADVKNCTNNVLVYKKRMNDLSLSSLMDQARHLDETTELAAHNTSLAEALSAAKVGPTSDVIAYASRRMKPSKPHK